MSCQLINGSLSTNGMPSSTPWRSARRRREREARTVQPVVHHGGPVASMADAALNATAAELTENGFTTHG